MQKPMIWIAFKLNQQYIYQNFCEQRDKPITICGGNCKLEKINQQQEERQEQMPELKIKDISFLPILFLHPKNNIICRQINWLPFINSLKVHLPDSQIFHPPNYFFCLS